MSELSPTPAHAPTRLELPHGAAVATQERVQVALALPARARARMHALVERLAEIAAAPLYTPASVQLEDELLVLEYELTPSLPFSAALPRWRASLAQHVPELIAMARYLDGCARELERLELPVMLAPAWLRYAPAGVAWPAGPFRLIAVPWIEAPLAEWARASTEAWAWTPGRALLGRREPAADGYAIGTALYTALAGELYPPLPPAEQFRRALRGHVGAPVALEQVVRAALPASFADEARALAVLVTELIAPEPPPDWRGRLEQLGAQLGARRTAVRWEYEGRFDTARAILERLAATAPKEHVPWEVLARLRSRRQDPGGALAAAIVALDGGDGDGGAAALRELVRWMRRIARGGAADRSPAAPWRDLLARAVDAVDQHGGKLDDTDRLQIAHVEARYMGRHDEAMRRLAAHAKGAWTEALRRAILARLLVGAAEWTQAARLCNEVRLAVQGMPACGGAPGAYLIAYVDYLDGVAHFGAVGQYEDPGYMADAFSRFVAALDGAHEVCEPGDPLIAASVHWLSWIGSLARQLRIPTADTIQIGVDAYLSARGLVSLLSDEQRREVPPLVWYDEDRLLAFPEES